MAYLFVLYMKVHMYITQLLVTPGNGVVYKRPSTGIVDGWYSVFHDAFFM